MGVRSAGAPVLTRAVIPAPRMTTTLIESVSHRSHSDIQNTSGPGTSTSPTFSTRTSYFMLKSYEGIRRKIVVLTTRGVHSHIDHLLVQNACAAVTSLTYASPLHCPGRGATSPRPPESALR